jgi:mono/diheme cytochrome c family protein
MLHRLKILPAAVLAAFAAVEGAEPDTVTWHRDIRPLLQRHCTDCHRPGGGAPFSLEAYGDAAKRSRTLLHVVAARVMPPWKADPAYRSFANERGLSESEIKLLRRWVRDRAPLGDPASAPPREDKAPAQAAPRETKTAKADLVLRMPRPFVIPAGSEPTYICVKIPYEIARDTFVRAAEFLPGNRDLVHHASYQVLEVADGVDTRAGPEVYRYGPLGDAPDDRQFEYFKLNGRDPSGKSVPPRLVFHTGWLPGVSAQKFPPGTGFRLPKKGVVLIRSLHYSPSPVKASDRSAVRFTFTRPSDGPVERVVQFAAFKPDTVLGPNPPPLMIPADTVVRFTIDNVVPLDASVLAINPHMHLLGKSFTVFAVTPAGDTIKLVRIPEWDFNWQEFYRFRNPVKIPKGSRLRAEAWFDNTRANPVNPNDPPRPVHFERGMDDRDEMMRLVIQYVPWKEGDEAIVQEP